MRTDINGNTFRPMQPSDRFIYADNQYTVIDTTEDYVCAIREGNWTNPFPWEFIHRPGPTGFKTIANDADYIW